VRKQRPFLGDVADSPPLGRHVDARTGHELPVDLDGSKVGAFEAADQSQQRRFAAARCAENRDQCARAHDEVDPAQDRRVAERLGQSCDANFGHFQS